jgi:alpha-amylase
MPCPYNTRMNKVYFGICLHFHQPVGNFDNILERAYQKCYRPFLDVFEKYPEIKMTFHFSGCLLDYFEDKHPDFLDKVKRLADKGQIEMMGGGYYEPIFPSIPEIDAIGQINMMSGYVKKRFGQKVLGIWTPERVWVPELSDYYSKAGIKYSILDDAHFLKAGLKENELYGYFMTGHKGKEVAIFPSNKRLRYIIPFKMPAEIIDYFKDAGARHAMPLLTYGDDGEKFGEWPFTHDWVYQKQWLDKFFQELMKNRDWIETVKLSDYMRSNPPVKKIRIPEASYEEMMEWSGGSWMNFIKKYPETNHMVSRMHYVSTKVHKCTSAQVHKLEEARRELYKGQCNCAYWHGVFGGIYLYHLRKAVYEHLINAEKIIWSSEARLKGPSFAINEVDFYKNGKKAFIMENKDFSIIIDPKKGGIIRELDYRPLSINLVNTIARHEESYHKKIKEKINSEANKTGVHTIHEDIKTIDPGLKAEFVYDNHIRACLVDYIGDFLNAPYDAKKTKDKVILTRKGNVDGRAVMLTKEIGINNKKEIEVSYILKNLSKEAIDADFGIEFNLTMPYLNSDRYNYFADNKILASLNEKGSIPNPGSFSIKDSKRGLDINLKFSEKPQEVRYFPVKTVSQSERAYELNYQCSCILARWRIDSSPTFQVMLVLSIYSQ